jgi:hypothetical protein
MKTEGVRFLFLFIGLTVFLFGSVAQSEDITVLNATIRATGGGALRRAAISVCRTGPGGCARTVQLERAWR